MCSPTLVISAISSALSFQQSQAEANERTRQQNEQNRIAKQDAINKMAQEDLRIRQVANQSLDKNAVVERDRRKATATATVQAGESGVSGISVDRLMADFMRQEGEFKNSTLTNLKAELQQSDSNKKSISIGQSANSTSVSKFNPLPSFANASLAFANDYYTYRDSQAQKEADIKKAEKYGGYLT